MAIPDRFLCNIHLSLSHPRRTSVGPCDEVAMGRPDILPLHHQCFLLFTHTPKGSMGTCAEEDTALAGSRTRSYANYPIRGKTQCYRYTTNAISAPSCVYFHSLILQKRFESSVTSVLP